MRARTINEANNFERGLDPKAAMGTGKIVEVKKLLDKVYHGRNHWLTYKIHDLDNIEVFYSNPDDYKDPEKLREYKWFLKYVELDKFKYNSHSSTISIHSNQEYHSWVVYQQRFCKDPHEKDNICEEFVLKIGKEIKDSEKKVKIIVDALNKEYDKIPGFIVTKVMTPKNAS
jgi:hypothetical protein